MDYGYDEPHNITPQQLLQKITQQQIFELALGKPFEFSGKYTSPLRADRRPDCKFVKREDGTILFVDFGDIITHRNCFKMIMELKGLSFDATMSYLIKHFGLTGDRKGYSEVADRKIDEEKEDKQRVIITYDKKSYDKRDMLLWSKSLIIPEELEEDSVFSVRRFFIRNRKPIIPYGPCFAIDFGHAVKIYQPLSTRYKWLSNCTKDDIGNFNNLPASGDLLIITKSYKDHRVLRNLGLGLHVIWFQNEGCVPSAFILRNLVSRFKKTVFLFDNDYRGTMAAMKLCDIINQIKADVAMMRHLPLFVSRGEDNWKDPAEFINKEGRVDLITTIKQLL